LRQARRDPAQGPPNSNGKLREQYRGYSGQEESKKSSDRCLTGAMAMKLFTGWAISAALVVAATAANAQTLAPIGIGSARYQAASDVQGPAVPPYAGPPPDAPVTRYGPTLMPPLEVYTVVRENGFSPLGIPHQRGYVYVIAVIDRAGEDGRLIIDARNGRILRFMPAYRMGRSDGEDYPPPYGAARGPYGRVDPGPYGAPGAGPYGAVPPGMGPPVGGPLPPTGNIGGGLRPPASIPRVASRNVPMPEPKPPQTAAKPALAPVQQSAAVPPKPADTPTAPVVGQARPAPTIQPTQEMPKVQGLD
jgi:hypothetical protein